MKKLLLVLPIILVITTSKAQITLPEGKSLEFSSVDNNFQVKMGFRFQNLLTVEQRSDEFFNDPQINALVRRSRLKFDGHLYDTTFTFKFEMGMSNRDIGARSDFEEVNSSSRLILDAVAKFKPYPGLEIWFGQTKLPGNRERVVSSQKLQFVDRSLLNSRFNIDRDMGVQVHYQNRIGKKQVYRIMTSLSMGEGRNITVGNQGGLDYTGRVEFLPFGLFAKDGDYFEADLKREKKHKVSIGATFDYNDNASRQRGQLGNFVTDTAGNPYYADLQTIFIDLIYKYRGFSLMFEYADKNQTTGLKAHEQEGTIDPNRKFITGTSENIQAGYLFRNNVEVALRYTAVRKDNDDSGLRDQNEYTVGVSRYIIGHKLKIQSDLSLTDDMVNPEPDMRFRLQIEFGF